MIRIEKQIMQNNLKYFVSKSEQCKQYEAIRNYLYLMIDKLNMC